MSRFSSCFVFQLRNTFSLSGFFFWGWVFFFFFELANLLELHKQQRIKHTFFFLILQVQIIMMASTFNMKFPLLASQLQFHVSKHVAVFPMVFDKTVEVCFLLSLKNHFLARNVS